MLWPPNPKEDHENRQVACADGLAHDLHDGVDDGLGCGDLLGWRGVGNPGVQLKNLKDWILLMAFSFTIGMLVILCLWVIVRAIQFGGGQ